MEDEIATLKAEIQSLKSLSLRPSIDQVFAVSVKLPPFDTDNLFAWFGMCEAQFKIRPITSSTTKASYILANISVEAYRILTPWLLDQGGNPTYEELKQELLLTFDQGQADRAQKILQFASIGMGDLNPRQLANEIERLRSLPDGSQIDICIEIFLQALPAGVRKLLGDIDSLSLKEVSERAFKAWKQFKADRQFSQSVSSVNSNLHEEVMAVSNFRNRNPVRNRDHVVSPSSPASDSWCFYHRKFGDNARSCVPPCSYKAKNVQRGRRP
jgi:hypothetical protein